MMVKRKNKMFKCVLLCMIIILSNLSTTIPFMPEIKSYAAEPEYYYDKYTCNGPYYAKLINSVNVPDTGIVYRSGYTEYFINQYSGQFEGAGEYIENSTTQYLYELRGKTLIYNTSPYPNYVIIIFEIDDNGSEKTRGKLVQSDIVAPNKTYPNDGLHTDGYWYVRKNPVNPPPVLSVIAPVDNSAYSLAVTPSISVYDPDGDTVTCKYYLNNSTEPAEIKVVSDTSIEKIVSFATLDLTELINKSHTMRFEITDGNSEPISKTVRFVAGVGYYYDKYRCNGPYYAMPVGSVNVNVGSRINRSGYRDYFVNQYTGHFEGVGEYIENSTSEPLYSISGARMYYNTSQYPYYSEIIFEIRSVGGEKTRGSLLQSDIVDVDGAYPDNGLHKDGYWYIKKEQFSAPPYITGVIPTINTVFNTTLTPSIRVCDPNGDLLTCKLYLGDDAIIIDTREVSNTATEQTVSFKTIDLSSYSNGSYTLRFEVSDNKEAPVQQTTIFYVDRQAPTLGNVTYTPTNDGKGITITGSATDDFSGLAENPYRYSVGSIVGEWTKNTTQTISSLLPNMQYTVKFEARDRGGNIATNTKNLYTRALVPVITLDSISETTASVTFLDGNPQGTRYRIYVNNSPITSWLVPANGRIAVSGLSSNTLYDFQARAINEEGIETELSPIVKRTTLASPPLDVRFSATRNDITITWGEIVGALGYDIELNGSVLVKEVNNTTYTCTNLGANNEYRIRIRTNNVSGVGNWSETYIVRTLPLPPATPTNLQAIDVSNRSLTLGWDWIVGSTGYRIEINDNQIVVVEGTDTSQYIFENIEPDTEYTYRIAAFNTGGDSPWSEKYSVYTLPDPPEKPENLAASATINTIMLFWNNAPRAENYKILADGVIVYTGSYTTFKHEGLDPVSKHTYRVKAVNRGYESDWSEEVTITTLPEKPVTPSSILASSDNESISLSWYKVPYAEKYEVEINGNKIVSTDIEAFTDTGLLAGVKYTYRIRAINISGISEWSKEISVETLPENKDIEITLANVAAIVTNESILISWEAATIDGKYDIEVDGLLIDNGSDRTYNHTSLQPETYHTYKIRVRNDEGLSEWCAILFLCTLPNPPQTPVKMEAVAENSRIELFWERVDGADSYELEIDSTEIVEVTNEKYIHENLEPGTSHIYRIRAKNISGVTAWSPILTRSTTSPTYIADCIKGKDFDLSLVAENVQDFSNIRFVIFYDPEELEIFDLYKGTPNKDIIDGPIHGTMLNAKLSEGKIEFTVNDSILPGTSWSGEIAAVTFHSKNGGKTYIDVMIDTVSN